MGYINLPFLVNEYILPLFLSSIFFLLPIYLSILTNSSLQKSQYQEVKLLSNRLIVNTILFVFGISSTFIILGYSENPLNYFLKSNEKVVTIMCGLLIMIMGIFHFKYTNIPFLQKEKGIHIEIKEMKPLTAYILGFIFSFGWTPCIEPMLSSVSAIFLISNDTLIGSIMILIYTIQYIFLFTIFAICYTGLLKLLRKKNLNISIIKKISGVILVISGLIIILGVTVKVFVGIKHMAVFPIEYIQSKVNNRNNAPDFSLIDQNGKTHKLRNYKGKIIVLYFCSTLPSSYEGGLSNVEEIYKEYKKNSEDVIILVITSPNTEVSKRPITTLLNNNQYEFPVIFDNTKPIMDSYNIYTLPTTIIIDKESNISSIVSGTIDKTMINILIDMVN